MPRPEEAPVMRAVQPWKNFIEAIMTVQNLAEQTPFVTKDGSAIRSILDRTNAPVKEQSLAEATVQAGGATQRHYHKKSEEFYFVLKGRGRMEIDGETREVGVGDAILIPAGAWHTIAAEERLKFLCCCAPAYSHEDTYFE
jgi:mannose-6-phosphate isomerase-like protein (cupin superfamily)